MAVLLEHDDGYFICHRTWSSMKIDSQQTYILRSVLFDLKSPFLFDLQASKIASNWSELWSSAIDLSHYPGEENEIIRTALCIVSSARTLGLLKNAPEPSDYDSNNKDARWFVKEFLKKDPDLPTGQKCSDVSTVLDLNGRRFLFPEKSEAIVGDVSSLQAVLDRRSFDLIVIDPPWENKMVRRKRKRSEQFGYPMMEGNSISNLPIKSILSPGGIVAVWCTNKAVLKEMVLQKFFKQWDLQHIASWYWVKITQSGEFTTPLGKDKKPYELLLFGRKMGAESATLPLPMTKTIVSIPAAIHSFKPPLNEVLKPFLPPDAKCLEIFSRSLIPNWVSYGNEAFKLQNMELYELQDTTKT